MKLRRFLLVASVLVLVLATYAGLTKARAATVCTPTTTISSPYSFDGAGDFCWKATSMCSYINSWNLTALEVNGTSYLNIWVSGPTIAPLNGSYAIHYNSTVSFGHFEIGAPCSGVPTSTTGPSLTPSRTPTAGTGPTNTPTRTLTPGSGPSLTPTRTSTKIPTNTPASGARQMEKLNRGLVRVNQANGNYVSWRLLGTDSASVSFNVYRNGTKLTSSPITNSTNYFDSAGTASSSRKNVRSRL